MRGIVLLLDEGEKDEVLIDAGGVSGCAMKNLIVYKILLLIWIPVLVLLVQAGAVCSIGWAMDLFEVEWKEVRFFAPFLLLAPTFGTIWLGYDGLLRWLAGPKTGIKLVRSR